MPRPKKDGRYINYCINRDIYECFEKYCSEVGQTKTVAIERILKKYLSEYYERMESNK